MTCPGPCGLVSTIDLGVDPFAPDCYWGHVSREDIAEAIARNRLEAEPYSHPGNGWREAGYDHAGRIAYLATNFDATPLVIERRPNGKIKLRDGHHRLAAALYTNRPQLQVRYVE